MSVTNEKLRIEGVESGTDAGQDQMLGASITERYSMLASGGVTELTSATIKDLFGEDEGADEMLPRAAWLLQAEDTGSVSPDGRAEIERATVVMPIEGMSEMSFTVGAKEMGNLTLNCKVEGNELVVEYNDLSSGEAKTVVVPPGSAISVGSGEGCGIRLEDLDLPPHVVGIAHSEDGTVTVECNSRVDPVEMYVRPLPSPAEVEQSSDIMADGARDVIGELALPAAEATDVGLDLITNQAMQPSINPGAEDYPAVSGLHIGTTRGSAAEAIRAQISGPQTTYESTYEDPVKLALTNVSRDPDAFLAAVGEYGNDTVGGRVGARLRELVRSYNTAKDKAADVEFTEKVVAPNASEIVAALDAAMEDYHDLDLAMTDLTGLLDTLAHLVDEGNVDEARGLVVNRAIGDKVQTLDLMLRASVEPNNQRLGKIGSFAAGVQGLQDRTKSSVLKKMSHDQAAAMLGDLGLSENPSALEEVTQRLATEKVRLENEALKTTSIDSLEAMMNSGTVFEATIIKEIDLIQKILDGVMPDYDNEQNLMKSMSTPYENIRRADAQKMFGALHEIKMLRGKFGAVISLSAEVKSRIK